MFHRPAGRRERILWFDQLAIQLRPPCFQITLARRLCDLSTVQSGYDRWALVYDHDVNPLPALEEPIVRGLVLEHLRDLESFFTDARRVLKPGGCAVVSTMHPAMFLRGSQARFTDPDSGELVEPGSLAHSLSDLVMGAIRAGFRLSNVDEFAPDEEFASRYPRAEKYVGWPMLVVMQLVAE